MKKQRTIIISLVLLVFLAVVAGGWYFIHRNGGAETYQSAVTKCGGDPVIGSEGIYYAPGPANRNMSYMLLSLYDPANLKISDYPNPQFFCSVGQAKAAGYQAHSCCGVVTPENKQ